MEKLHMVTFVLAMVGALNWGLVGLFSYNLVESLLGAWPMFVQLVYVLVGASAVYELATHAQRCKDCMAMMKK